MELDELKKSCHVVKAPPELGGKTTEASRPAIDSVIEKLKIEDAKQLIMLKRARPIWVIAAVFWVLSSVGILLTSLESSRQIDAGLPLRGLLALIFSGLAIAFFVQMRKISAIDYTESASLFLRKAARRYQFMTTPYLIFSILVTIVLALAVSMYVGYVFERYLNIHDANAAIIASFAFIALVYLFGYSVSKKAWKKTRLPMLEEIRNMQHDLQNDSE